MKLNHVIEARYYGDADYFSCPDCDGEGGFMFQDGPDDWDMEPCEMCSGKGRISKHRVQLLTRNGLYSKKDFRPILEASYMDTAQRIVGELFLDDRNLDDYFHEEDVAISYRMLNEDDRSPGTDNAVLADVRTKHGEESWLASKIGLKEGDSCYYMKDDRGEILSGWWGKSPWSIESR